MGQLKGISLVLVPVPRNMIKLFLIDLIMFYVLKLSHALVIIINFYYLLGVIIIIIILIFYKLNPSKVPTYTFENNTNLFKIIIVMSNI